MRDNGDCGILDDMSEACLRMYSAMGAVLLPANPRQVYRCVRVVNTHDLSEQFYGGTSRQSASEKKEQETTTMGTDGRYRVYDMPVTLLRHLLPE